VLTVFPNGSIPLSPPTAWKGAAPLARRYTHDIYRLTLVLVASADTAALPCMDLASLRRKLSAYFTSVSPDRLSPPWLLPRWFEDDEPLYDPGTLASRVPVSLHFWDGERDVPPAYPGGAGDSGLVNGETPNRDVVGSHSLLMMSGHCSPSFTAHVRWYGHAPSRAPTVVRTVLRVMSLHAMNLHARYTALARGQQLRPEDRRRAPQRRRPPAWGGRRPAAPVPPRPPPPPRSRQAPVVRKRYKAPVVHLAKRPRLSHSAKRCESCNGFSCDCGLSGALVVAPPSPPPLLPLSSPSSLPLPPPLPPPPFPSAAV